ncbi:xaa-Pro aminopeptidase 3-like isoform X2 [Ostrea edulis]|uniref:xaa-Pro aminopeptidase 3-like isoform X2 n=1 Tax=Ostrea edulis TaxID=37623 RepID=UPI002094F455|nr:xaa-Pro aminopeptidase 3-like isoform X2 [Ostrea edulis]XP_048777070.1 xaa-Pro aminopeptidase 3-like isoform X2 [Ostrea edulis]XP_048777071.1 xaa-Pro aminopeptidase 3-like isoform X2 [Ostrea edulis]XP_048777072.1 xaa-Pro aminopeptidase 3-like isoform X2 [Ostrea edulis]XP_048777073.1 xaa-Pro aminopeptidase 3-like isoform X2 [Ostrea edulis]XP_056010573.1 xaa-Pro aminopeptidase 3-like isoform X2 [Ostrea edulis]
MMGLLKRYRLISAFMTHHRRMTTAFLSPKLQQVPEKSLGITVEEYKARRRSLMQLCVESEPLKSVHNHLLCIPAAPLSYFSVNNHCPFRQNTEFNYLCGYLEANCVLFMFTEPGKSVEDFKSLLFLPQSLQEVWYEKFEGFTNIVESTGVDEARFTKDIASFLSTYIKDNNKFTLWYNYQKTVNSEVHRSVMADFLRQGKYKKLKSFDYYVQSLRMVKSEAEIALMKRSMEITSAAFRSVHDMIDEWKSKSQKELLSEYEIQAVLEYTCSLNGGRLAYIPVVAGGNRGNTIHYVQNNNKLNPEELLLIDAGCEYKGYTTDITRVINIADMTFEQEAIIGIVQLIQETCIKMCTPEYSLNEIYRKMMAVLGEYVQTLGFMDTKLEGQFNGGAQLFCPHHVGHYLGMDLHDTPLVSKEMKLQPGTILTIEPGLYFRPEYVPDKLSQFRGIAVRLEDNILVTKSGPVNLSQSVSPREKVFACDADSIQSSVDIHNFMASLRKGKI